MSAVLMLVVCGLSLVAQTRDAQTPRPSQTGTAAISGRVVNALDGSPLRRVQLQLRDENTAVVSGRLAVTNENGQFAFRDLPAGRFQLTASKPAFLPMAYGMKRPARPGGAPAGSALVLAEGQQASVEMKLTRGSAIGGIVRDASGQPAGGVRVTALAYARPGNTSERTLVSQGETVGTTDDRGGYRIFGLPPGEYIVAISNVGMSSGEIALLRMEDIQRADELLRSGAAPAGSAPTPSPRPKTIGFVPVYHPGTNVLTDATTLTLGPGEEKNDVDIRLQYVSTGRVTGTVTGVDGSPAAGVSVRLVGQTPGGGPGSAMSLLGSGGVTDKEGRYAIAGVAPGRYAVSARTGTTARPGTSTSAPSWADAEVAVNGDDHSVNLSLQPGMTISGRIIFDGPTPPQDLSNAEIVLMPEAMSREREMFSQAYARSDATGRFVISGVIPGKYRVSTALIGMSGWTLRTATFGSVDAAEYPFEVRPGVDVTDGAVTMTNRVTEVSGRLIDGDNAPVPDFTVIIFPVDAALWPLGQARRIQGLRPAQDGKFTFRNLASGDYFIGAADDVERGDWFDPAFLKAMAAGGAVKVTVAEGEKKVQDLRVR